MKEIIRLRKEIDRCDSELIALFAKRFAIVKRVAEFKKKNDLPSLDPQRLKEIKARIITLSKKKKISIEFAEKIMDSIHDEAIKIEENIISKNKK